MSLLTPVEVQPAAEVGPVHFIAIGGSGMNGIARLYAKLGVPVSGSDRSESATLDALREAGITCYAGHEASQLGDARTVVISSAIREACGSGIAPPPWQLSCWASAGSR